LAKLAAVWFEVRDLAVQVDEVGRQRPAGKLLATRPFVQRKAARAGHVQQRSDEVEAR
jgi:hypothetical protein